MYVRSHNLPFHPPKLTLVKSDFADEHPAAEILGVDLSPIQPSFAPPNCKFEVDDITAPWAYEPPKFDFIHIRTLYGTWPPGKSSLAPC